MVQPFVAVPADIREFDGYIWHAVPQPYLEAAVGAAGVIPLTIPSFGSKRLDIDQVLAAVDGVMLTGSKSNVHPSHYGEEATEANGPYDPGRDSTTLPLVRRALELGVPLLAICRGIQELNVALGGTLHAEIQEQEGLLDHRAANSTIQDERFAIHQPVTVREGTCLASILGAGEFTVNTLHRQAIGKLGYGLEVEAVAPDGVVEAVSVSGAKAFAVGVQWHPEYWAASDETSARIFKAFGDAARAHWAARTGARQAAE